MYTAWNSSVIKAPFIDTNVAVESNTTSSTIDKITSTSQIEPSSPVEISTYDKEVHILEFIESQYSHRETTVIVITLLYMVLFILGLVGNICIIYWHVAPKSSYYQRTTSNILVINLCLSDLLVTFFCCPFVAYAKNTTIWRFGEIPCTLVHYMQGKKSLAQDT